jgi:hypothetical protein
MGDDTAHAAGPPHHSAGTAATGTAHAAAQLLLRHEPDETTAQIASYMSVRQLGRLACVARAVSVRRC